MIDGYVYSEDDYEEPYVLVKDDDSHWYLIPESLRFRFYKLSLIGETKNIIKEFSKYGIDCPTKLRIVKWI